MNIVRCPPVTMVLIRRPDLRYQLGFSVQNGIVSKNDHHNTKNSTLYIYVVYIIINNYIITLHFEFLVRKMSEYIQLQ